MKLRMTLVIVAVIVCLVATVAVSQAATLRISILEDQHGPVVEAFQEKYPDINVETTLFTGDHDEILMQFVGGIGADIQFLSWYEYIDRFIDAGVFQSLNRFIERSDAQYMIDQIPQPVVERFSRNGELYAISDYLHMRGVGINRNYREDRGLGLPDSNWDWDDFISYSLRLTQQDSDGEVSVYGTTVNTHWAIVQAWMVGAGAQIHDPNDPSVITLDSPEAIQALEFLQDVTRRHRPYRGIAWGILEGNVAMQNGMASNYARIMHNSPFDYDVAETPLGPAGQRAIVVNDSSFYMSAGTRYPEEAWKFLEFYLSAEGQRIYMQTTGFQPARTDLVGDWIEIVQTMYPSITDEWFVPFLNAYAYAQTTHYFTDSQVISEYLHPAFQEIVNQGASARATMESVVPAANAFIAGRK